MQNSATWTDDRVALLQKLWANGDSCSQIAEKISGVSRNAVIGKANRLGLEKRRDACLRVVKPRQPRLARQYQKARRSYDLFTPFETPAPLPEFLGLPWVEVVEAKTCMYPEGDGAHMLFCGQPRKDGSSYCPAHHRICWVKPNKPKPNLWRRAA